jgi:hypothetical protein
MFKCRLEIDSKIEKLSAENGLTIQELGGLLLKLGKCIENKGHKFILTGLDFHSYDPVFVTDTLEAADEFLDIHETVITTDYEDLPFEYREYADELDYILKERGVYINATHEKSERKIEITEINKAKVGKSYHTISNITAKIVSINGKNESEPYIVIEDYRGKLVRVNIKAIQESELSQFYKKYFIRFRIRIKRNPSSKLQVGSLLAFNVPAFKTLAESIEAAKAKYGDIFSNIIDSAKAIKELREDKYE